MTTASPTVLSVRVTAQERHVLEAAATQARTTLSDFVRRKAVEAAENEVLDGRVVTIAAADWERFEAWAQSPAREIPVLRELAEKPRPWRD